MTSDGVLNSNEYLKLITYIEKTDPKAFVTVYAVNEVINHIHNGAIILLHAVSKDNAEALSDVIDYAMEQGYEFRELDYLVKR